MVKYYNQPQESYYKMRIAFGTSGNADGRQEYIGFAATNAAETDAKWQIYKLTYNSSGQVTERNFADGKDDFIYSWSNRGSYTYT